MNDVANRKVICDVLSHQAESDKSIIVLCSDSRGSASMTSFFEAFPRQSLEIGIAEQNIVTIAAGLAVSGKKPFVFSPASFLSSRSYEQIKVDCAYSHTNVKLIGISGGISYGALGLTHHSVNDIAAITALPGMEVYVPSDRFQTGFLIEALLEESEPAYVRVGRNSVEDVYHCGYQFAMKHASVPHLDDLYDVLIVACGEMVRPSLDAVDILAQDGIASAVIDMYCLKPFDEGTLLDLASQAKAVVTVEEHSPYGGLGALVDCVIARKHPMPVANLSLPDTPVIAGTSKEIFKFYGLDAYGITGQVKALLERI